MSNLRVMKRRSNFLQPPTITGFVDDDGLPVPLRKERTLTEMSRAMRAHRAKWGGAKVLLTEVGAKGPAGYVKAGQETYISECGYTETFQRWERG
jgi:hypothetical protein